MLTRLSRLARAVAVVFVVLGAAAGAATAQEPAATPTDTGDTLLTIPSMDLPMPGAWQLLGANGAVARFRPANKTAVLVAWEPLETDRAMAALISTIADTADKQLGFRPVDRSQSRPRPGSIGGLPGLAVVGVREAANADNGRVAVAHTMVAIGRRYQTFSVVAGSGEDLQFVLDALDAAVGKRRFRMPLVERVAVGPAEMAHVFNVSLPQRLGEGRVSLAWPDRRSRNQFELRSGDTPVVWGELVLSPAFSPRTQLGNFAYRVGGRTSDARVFTRHPVETAHAVDCRLPDGTVILGMIVRQTADDSQTVRTLPAVLVARDNVTLMIGSHDRGNGVDVLRSLIAIARGVTFAPVSTRADLRAWLIKRQVFHYNFFRRGPNSVAIDTWKWTFHANGTADIHTNEKSTWSVGGSVNEPLNPYNAGAGDWMGMNANNPMTDKPWMLSGSGQRTEKDVTGVAFQTLEANGKAWIVVREPEGFLSIHRLTVTRTSWVIDGYDQQSEDNRKRIEDFNQPEPGRPIIE